MKRSVAIIGKTPMFLRWAIEHACPLRDIFPARLAESTFRQLRGLREVSLAQQQKRTHLGYCLHPDALADNSDQLYGFSVDEVVGIFGGPDFVSDQCAACPANIQLKDQAELWCGCYGGVSTDLRTDFQALARGEYREFAQRAENDQADRDCEPDLENDCGKWWDLPNLIERVVGENFLHNELEKLFPASRSPWFALWQVNQFDQDKLNFIELVLRLAIKLFENELHSRDLLPGNAGQQYTEDLKRFHLALDFARNRIPEGHGKLSIELVPAGHSNGRTWQIDPHCKNCRRTWTDRTRLCVECGERGQYQNEIKLKVLGLRPYVQLAGVIGIKEAEKLIESYRNQIIK